MLGGKGSVMNYCSGEHVRAGDHVFLGRGEGGEGRVVCSIDDAAYTPEHLGSDWAYLQSGVMIEFRAFGLVHYTEPDPDLRLVAREAPSL
jgi:hypothetical protein